MNNPIISKSIEVIDEAAHERGLRLSRIVPASMRLTRHR